MGLFFWFVVRALMRADRNERQAYATIDKEERERAAQQRGDAPENPDGP